MGWASSGFEIGNKLDARTYPVARLKRPGPPPTTQPADFDPAALRGSPIRARPVMFHLREISGRSLLALGSFVGPGLIKRLDYAFLTTANNNPESHINLFRDSTPYATATNLATTTLPHGVAVFEAKIADDQPAVFSAEGGLDVLGNPNTYPGSILIDVYVPDAQFYLALVGHAPTAAGVSITGSLLVYEGVLASDFPAILG